MDSEPRHEISEPAQSCTDLWGWSLHRAGLRSAMLVLEVPHAQGDRGTGQRGPDTFSVQDPPFLVYLQQAEVCAELLLSLHFSGAGAKHIRKCWVTLKILVPISCHQNS